MRWTGLSDPSLAAAEWRAWREDGFFVRERAFAEAELRPLREAVERVDALARAAIRSEALVGRSYCVDGNGYVEWGDVTIQLEHRPGAQSLRVLEPFHHLDPRLDALVDDARLVEPMRELVASRRIALFTSKLNLKRGRDGSRFRWHQDSPYWLHAGAPLDRLPNVMLALDDATEHNGCLRVVPGSHRAGMLPGLEGQGTLDPLFTDPRVFDVSAQVALSVPAGSLIFFSPYCVHGSEPNRTPAPRRAMVLTYQPGGRPLLKGGATRNAVTHGRDGPRGGAGAPIGGS